MPENYETLVKRGCAHMIGEDPNFTSIGAWS